MAALARKPMNTLASVEEASRILAEARSIDDVKDVRDKAEALRMYLKQQQYSLEAQNDAAEIKLRAERRGGELLSELDLKPGPKGDACTLQAIGIEQTQSHRWQRIAGVPVSEFEQHIRSTRERQQELTTSSVLKLAKKIAAKETNAQEQPEITGSHSCLSTIGEKYGCIYADPPWSYGNQGTRASTDNHYPTMSVDEICALPVSDLALDNAHLHLWTTNAFLQDSFRVMAAWGFTYKSVMVWCKPEMGIGNYWRVSHEFLMFGIRGDAPFRARDVKSWQEHSRGEHSQKPHLFRSLIEKVSPGPYLELFARRAAPGWTVFGNQIEHDLYTQKTE